LFDAELAKNRFLPCFGSVGLRRDEGFQAIERLAHAGFHARTEVHVAATSRCREAARL